MIAPAPDLVHGGRAIPLAQVRSFEALLAADNPGRLRVQLQAGGEERPSLEKPGGEVSLSIAGVERFRGRVAGAVTALERGAGPLETIEVRPEWHARAERLPFEEEYSQVTDAEVAARLADALGLEADIEPTTRIHRSLVREGEPHEFLKRRARAAGRRFAIAEGVLIFSPSLPGDAPLRLVGPAAPVLSLRSSRGAGGAGGTIVLDGAPQVFPLDRLRIEGFGPPHDGLRRVSGVSIGFRPRALWTEIRWIEES